MESDFQKNNIIIMAIGRDDIKIPFSDIDVFSQEDLDGISDEDLRTKIESIIEGDLAIAVCGNIANRQFIVTRRFGGEEGGDIVIRPKTLMK